ncbi:MAG TPA: dihydrofolate reductase [Candidatus Synoicihabitans sp.]|nr:dihydrofolate reductase [Candidatus Synoicihabitans sp.]
MAKPIRIIVAAARNRVIGRAGKLPWHIPEDRNYLERTTAGHTVIMGRWSYVGWPEATRGRDVIVVTRQKTLTGGVLTAASLTEALALADQGRGETFVCGGQRIYEEALPLAELLYLTLVDADVVGDTYFPDWHPHFHHERSRRDSRDAHWRYSFLVLGRTGDQSTAANERETETSAPIGDRS